MNYDINYFINKFEAIPEDQWGTRYYNKTILGHTKYCVLGHCGLRHDKDPSHEIIQEYDALYSLLRFGIVKINDGHNPDYQQPTPKQRILAALYDIKPKCSISDNFEDNTDLTKGDIPPVKESLDIIKQTIKIN